MCRREATLPNIFITQHPFFLLYFTLGIPKASSMFQAKAIHFIYYSAELWLVLVVAAPALVEWKFKLDSSRALEALHFFKVIVV